MGPWVLISERWYKLLKQHIANKPNDIEANGLIAEMYIHKRDFSRAEKYLTIAIVASTKTDTHFKSAFGYLQNLIGLFVILRQPRKATAACELYLTRWPKGEKPNEEERNCLLSLLKFCLNFGLYVKGRELWSSCREFFDENDAATLEIEGRLALALDSVPGRADAVQTLGKAKELDPASFSIACAYAAATHSSDPQRSEKAARDACRLMPVATCGRLPTQVQHFLILSNAPTSIKSQNIKSLDLHFRGNYPSQFCRIKQNKYLFSSAFPEFSKPFDLRELPKVQLIINNLASPEAISPDLHFRSNALIDKLDAPVLNSVDSTMDLRRSALPNLLSGIDGVRVPKTVRVERDGQSWDDVANRAEAEFDYPLILRSPAAHESSSSLIRKDLKNVSAKLVASKTEFIELSEAKNWDSFYAIEFFDLRKPSNVYRKIRAVIIGDEIIIHSLVFWSDWMVGGWRIGDRARQFYEKHPECWQEGLAALRDPEGYIGLQTLETLRTIRKHISLDFFGIDFDIDDDGEIALFEVSAAMLFLPAGTPPAGLELPPEPYDRINAAFERLIEKRIASAARR